MTWIAHAAKGNSGSVLSSAPPAMPSSVRRKRSSQWVSGRNGVTRAKWKVEDGYVEIVPRTGRLYQQSLGLPTACEWMVPASATRKDGHGKRGVELMTRYEIQVLESNEI